MSEIKKMMVIIKLNVTLKEPNEMHNFIYDPLV